MKMSVFFIYREFIYLAVCSHTLWWGQEQALGVDSVLEILVSQRYLFSEFACITGEINWIQMLDHSKLGKDTTLK